MEERTFGLLESLDLSDRETKNRESTYFILITSVRQILNISLATFFSESLNNNVMFKMFIFLLFYLPSVFQSHLLRFTYSK